MSESVPEADYANYLQLISFGSGKPCTQDYPFISPALGDMSGKSVFITGASQGIGRRAAIAFAEAGCSNIAISSRSEHNLATVASDAKAAAREAGRAEPRVLTLRMDVTSEDDVKAAVEAVELAFDGALDVLVNNAGALEEHAFVAQSDPMDWWNVWEVNVRGTYLVTKHFLPALLGSSLKTVVNMTSGMGIMLVQGYSSYSPSKVALCRFTEFLMSEYGAKGLLAFSFEPGLSDTRLAAQLHPILRDLPKDDAVLAPNSMVWLVRERREWLAGRIVSARWNMEEVLKKKEDIESRDLMKFKVALA